MRTLVVVTGRMRSGTSLVAQLVHRMGFPVCLTMTPPLPPQWDGDWEDVAALPELLRAAPLGWSPNEQGRAVFARWFRAYLIARQAAAEAANRIAGRAGSAIWGVAVKSPLYALLLPDVHRVATDLGLATKLVTTERPDADVEASIARTFGLLAAPHSPPGDTAELVRRTNRLIDEALDFIEGVQHIVDYPRLVGPAPRSTAELGALADYLDRPLDESLLACVRKGDVPCPGPR